MGGHVGNKTPRPVKGMARVQNGKQIDQHIFLVNFGFQVAFLSRTTIK